MRYLFLSIALMTCAFTHACVNVTGDKYTVDDRGCIEK